MGTQKAERGTQLRFESLEAKQMLAGDVFVDVVAGNLFIRGDELDNQIAITAGEAEGTYVIRGLDGTVIREAPLDGEGPVGEPTEGEEQALPAAPESGLVVEGVDRGAHVRMGAGDDLVHLHDLTLRGAVTIGTGGGDDRVLVGTPVPEPEGPEPANDSAAIEGETPSVEGLPNVRVGGSLRIATGPGADIVHVDQTAVRRDLLLRTGLGDDRVRLGTPEAATDEALATEGVAEESGASLRVGGELRAHLGAGEDQLVADGVLARHVHANGGFGSDGIHLDEVRARYVGLQGGGGEGADQIDVHRTHAAVLGVQTGAGDDHVRLIDSAFSMLAVGLGDGDDTLALGGVQTRLALLFGGPGEEDIYRDLGENRIGHQRLRGFELPVDEEPNGVV